MKRVWINLLVLPVAASGCARPAVDLLKPSESARVWPVPPDTPRIRFLGELKSSDDLQPAKSGLEAFNEVLFGPRPPVRMVSPHAVAVHPDGNRVAVADTNSVCVHVLDLAKRTYVRRESWTSGQQLFECPVGVAWADDALCAADSRLAAIAILEPSGSGRLIGRSELKRPAGLAYCVRNQLLYVTDAVEHAVLAFDRKGALAFRFGSRGAGPGQFNFPSQIACGPEDTLVVADSLNFRIQRFGLDGTPLNAFGGKGDAAGDLALPKAAACSADGNIWVVDAQFENVQGFTPEGKLLMAFGREGQGPGEFWLPAGIFIDARQRMWVADTYNRRVQVFEMLPQ